MAANRSANYSAKGAAAVPQQPQERKLQLNPAIRAAQFISILYLILVTGVTLVGQWAGVQDIYPEVRVVALTLFFVSAIIALGSASLLESTAKER